MFLGATIQGAGAVSVNVEGTWADGREPVPVADRCNARRQYKGLAISHVLAAPVRKVSPAGRRCLCSARGMHPCPEVGPFHPTGGLPWSSNVENPLRAGLIVFGGGDTRAWQYFLCLRCRFGRSGYPAGAGACAVCAARTRVRRWVLFTRRAACLEIRTWKAYSERA